MNRRRVNRRGDVGESLQWIYRIILAVILFWLLFIQIHMLVDFMKSPYRMELSLYQQRILNGVYAKEVETGRVLVGVVDVQSFTDVNVEKVYRQKIPVFGVRLKLFNNINSLEQDKPLIKPVLQPKDLVNKYMAPASAGLSDSGGGKYERHVYPVMIRGMVNKPPIPGWLEIEVVKLT